MSASSPARLWEPEPAVNATAALAGGGGSVVLLQPRRTWQTLDLGELWRYRDLLALLALRDIQVRYKQTFLGAAWAILQPLVTMGVLSLVLGQVLSLSTHTGKTPYPLFLFAGLLPWTFFATAVAGATNSLVNHAGMLQKIYFPRLIIPLATSGAALVDLVIASLVLPVLMLWYHQPLAWTLLFLPVALVSLVLAALGIGILTAALTVTYRDFRYVVPFVLQIWFFLTPVLLPASALPQRWYWLWRLNPLAGTIAVFRAAVLGTPVDLGAGLISLTMSAAFLLLGLWYFSRTERRFADVV